jgi:hypothetical protein
MKWNVAIAILMLLTTACSPTSATLEISPTDHATTASTSTSTVSTLAINLPSTATAKPTEASTPQYVPGVMSNDRLHNRVKDWIHGRLPFDDKDRLLDEITSEELKLGLLVEPITDMVIFNFYNLGHTLIKGKDGEVYVINMVGFEDGVGERFAFPYHIGKLSNTCQIVHLRLWEGRRVNHERKISTDELTPLELLQRSDELINHVNSAVTWSDARGRTGNPCINDVDHYYASSREVTEALVAFFECTDCKISNAILVISDWMNVVPEEFDPRIPYLRIYNVYY